MGKIYKTKSDRRTSFKISVSGRMKRPDPPRFFANSFPIRNSFSGSASRISNRGIVLRLAIAQVEGVVDDAGCFLDLLLGDRYRDLDLGS